MAELKLLSPDASTPKSAAKRLMLALRFGRKADILATLQTTSPDEASIAKAMAGMAEATSGLSVAAERQFGPQEAMPLTGGAAELAGALQQIDDSTQAGDGKTVTLIPRVAGEKLTLVAVGDEWKVPISALAATADLKTLASQLRVVELQTQAVRDVTGELEQGRYKDMAALARAIEGKSMVAASDATRPPQPQSTTLPATGPTTK